jgi:hypothetical protein
MCLYVPSLIQQGAPIWVSTGRGSSFRVSGLIPITSILPGILRGRGLSGLILIVSILQGRISTKRHIFAGT